MVEAVLFVLYVVIPIGRALHGWRTRRQAVGPTPEVIAALRACRARQQPLRCRVGDLAFIVRCSTIPSAIGMLVVVEARSTRPTFDWFIRSLGGQFEFPQPSTDGYTADCRDVCLQPLRSGEEKVFGRQQSASADLQVIPAPDGPEASRAF